MRIGIMGGTFDPIHNGHLMLGEYAYQQFHLDEVWYMPNGNPPHKSNPEIRKEMPGTGSADRGTETGVERRTSGSTVARMAAANDGQLPAPTEMSSGLLRSSQQ